MIICHCMSITDRDIRSAVEWMLAADPETLITPGKVYRALGKKAECGGCLPLFMNEMHQCEGFVIPAQGPEQPRNSTNGVNHERRREGHRVSQQGAAQRVNRC
jgi:bacterioferritin-associated ferredoxin